MRRRVVLTSLVLLAVSVASRGGESELSPWVEKAFVILKSTSSYEEALSFVKSAAARLNVEVDLRELSADGRLGLTFPRGTCEEEWGEFPCYFPRGRWDDGVYLSIEYSSGYKGFTSGLYIVVMANGSKESEEARAALVRAKAVYPDAYMKTTLVYLGCMH